MKYLTKFKLNQQQMVMRLGLSAGLGLLLIGALLWGLGSMSVVHANPSTLYVDGATGSNTTDCTDSTAPCATISYALSEATNGDEIHVAEGTYLETLDVGITATLKGGYTISGTDWLPNTGETIVDADGADDAVVWIYPDTDVVIESFTIQGANHTSDVGGGFLIDRASVIISDTVIQNNYTPNGGGGIHVEKLEGYPGSLSLINSSLLTNKADLSGGGLQSWGAAVTLENVQVRGNIAEVTGGGLNVNNALVITNSQFISNTAGDWGGGLWIAAPNNTLAISDSQFESNTAGGNGGGISIDGEFEPLNVSITNSSFLTNTAGNNGGGLACDSCQSMNTPLTMENVVVQGNSAQAWGGGLNVNGALVVTDSQIMGNTTRDGRGGGIHAVDLSVYNSVISGNKANGIGSISGGGVSVWEKLYLEGSMISDNSAEGTEEGIGGGIATGNDETTIVDTIISGNTAQYNAGISLYNSVFSITNSFIISNEGVGLAGNPITGTLTNVTVADNVGDGVQVGGDVTIINSIMWGNGYDYFCDSGCSLTYSNVGNGNDVAGTGNISADPLFVDPENGDYHLQSESPSINTGVNAGAPDNDFEGDSRPFDYIVDMGADEWWPFLAVALSSDEVGEGLPGTDVPYTLTVTNTGSYTDTINLAASGTWTPTLSTATTAPLGIGESYTVTLTVTVPPDAVVGAENVVTITATSGWTAMINDTVQVTTTVQPYKVYLPAILK